MSAVINGGVWNAESIFVDKKSNAVDLIGTKDSLQIDLEFIFLTMYGSEIKEGNYSIDDSIAGALLIIHYPNLNPPDTIYDAVLNSGSINVTKSKKGIISGNFEFGASDYGKTFTITSGVFENISAN